MSTPDEQVIAQAEQAAYLATRGKTYAGEDAGLDFIEDVVRAALPVLIAPWKARVEEAEQATIRVQDAMLAGREREKPVFRGSDGHQFQKRNGVVCYRRCGGDWIPNGGRFWVCGINQRGLRQAQES